MNIYKYYNEVVSGNRYDLEGAGKHNEEMISAKVKADDMPSIERNFISQNHYGCCLHYGMALFQILREHNIQSYIAITMEENPITHEKTDLHASVCYSIDGKMYIADPVETVKTGKGDFHEIPVDSFIEEQGTIWLYDPYGEYGNLLFFEGFLDHPVKTLKGG